MNPTPEQLDELEYRLMNKSHRVGECLLWTGYQDEDGYGHMRWNGRLWLTHRLGFICHTGKEPRFNVCHHCDNPSCWAEKHLFEGTQQDNIDDMISKGRHKYGDTTGIGYRLIEADVVVIKRMLREGYSQRFIANKFQVAQSHITHINLGRAWAHVD